MIDGILWPDLWLFFFFFCREGPVYSPASNDWEQPNVLAFREQPFQILLKSGEQSLAFGAPQRVVWPLLHLEEPGVAARGV